MEGSKDCGDMFRSVTVTGSLSNLHTNRTDPYHSHGQGDWSGPLVWSYRSCRDLDFVLPPYYGHYPTPTLRHRRRRGRDPRSVPRRLSTINSFVSIDPPPRFLGIKRFGRYTSIEESVCVVLRISGTPLEAYSSTSTIHHY